MNITHISVVHERNDTRIFTKMCCSLAKIKTNNVSLIVADGKSDEFKNGIQIIDIGLRSKNKLKRMIKDTKKIFSKAVSIDTDIYHLHDPELIPVGIKLKKRGAKVIFDAHEDLPKQILSKEYINIFIRKILSFFFKEYEKYICKKFDCIIAATPFIRNKFLKSGAISIDVNNFPKIDEFNITYTNWDDKNNEVCYVGGLSKPRGLFEMIIAMEKTSGIKLNLAGEYVDDDTEKRIKAYNVKSTVNQLGFINREHVCVIIRRSKAGLVILHKTPAYNYSLPVKMFEYMAGGIPVIASNIDYWKLIIEKEKCGICVDPLKPIEISEAIRFIVENPKAAEVMGMNGKKAILEKYNWSNEERKLLSIYELLYKSKNNSNLINQNTIIKKIVNCDQKTRSETKSKLDNQSKYLNGFQSVLELPYNLPDWQYYINGEVLGSDIEVVIYRDVIDMDVKAHIVNDKYLGYGFAGNKGFNKYYKKMIYISSDQSFCIAPDICTMVKYLLKCGFGSN